MVTKIQPPAERILNTLFYNELKMSGPEGVLSDEELEEYEDTQETGHVLATRNVPELSSLENEFSRLKMLNKRTTKGRPLTNPGFHMSVNPSEQEIGTSEETMVAFIDELMNRLGYGEVPYRIYKHTDIERTHYHVIATRIGQDGKKVNDAYENRRCNAITDELCRKYGFTLGKKDEKKADTAIAERSRPPQEPAAAPETPQNGDISREEGSRAPEGRKPKDAPKKADFVAPFKQGATGVDNQLKEIHHDAMRWSFSTPEQYVAILRYRYNTSADIAGDSLLFQGLDKDGEPAHTPRPENELGLNALAEVIERCSTAEMRKKRSQRKRVGDKAKECAEKASSWSEFKKMMARYGIYTVISWNEKEEPFGVTWLDRATRCAFKGSETEATIAWLKETAESKGWRITRDRRYEKKPKNETQVMARARLRRASTSEGIMKLASIKAVGHTHGTTGSAAYNKDRIKREGEEDKNEIIL